MPSVTIRSNGKVTLTSSGMFSPTIFDPLIFDIVDQQLSVSAIRGNSKSVTVRE